MYVLTFLLLKKFFPLETPYFKFVMLLVVTAKRQENYFENVKTTASAAFAFALLSSSQVKTG